MGKMSVYNLSKKLNFITLTRRKFNGKGEIYNQK